MAQGAMWDFCLDENAIKIITRKATGGDKGAQKMKAIQAVHMHNFLLKL